MSGKLFCGGESSLSAGLERWYDTPVGQYLLEQEWQCLEGLLDHTFGYHLLQVGKLGLQQRHLQASKIQSQVLLAPDEAMPERGGRQQMRVTSRFDRLPIASDSVDAVLLPHTIDFSSDPHMVIREVERVLIGDGRVIITAFNPWSLWGVWRLVHLRSGQVPWCGQFVSPSRVMDWLTLLGFEIEKRKSLIYRPPLNYKGLVNKFRYLDRIGARYWPLLSGVYVIQAVKRVTPLTPRRANWKLRAPGIRGQVVEPSARSGNGV